VSRKVVPIFGVAYELRDFPGTVLDDSGRPVMGHSDHEAKVLLISSSVPTMHREHLIAILVAKEAEYIQAHPPKGRLILSNPQPWAPLDEWQAARDQSHRCS
jgi:hypothetical protein